MRYVSFCVCIHDSLLLKPPPSVYSGDQPCSLLPKRLSYQRICWQEKDALEMRLSDVLEQNAALDFERARVKDGYGGPLRRMVSYTSAEFLNGSQLQLSGAYYFL